MLMSLQVFLIGRTLLANCAQIIADLDAAKGGAPVPDQGHVYAIFTTITSVTSQPTCTSSL